MHSRREFLAAMGAAAAAVAAAPLGAVTTRLAQQRKLERVGIQLYTLRREMQADVAATLRSVAAIGYREVEFAGYFGNTPDQVTAMLRANNLTSPSTHVGLPADPEAWKRAVDEARAVGHEVITVPSLPRGQRATVDDWKRLAGEFNKAAEVAKAAGLKFAFHNHDAEFRPVANTVPYDVMVSETDPALVGFQIDVYWMVRAGHDPLDYFRRFPGRFLSLHLKDSAGAPEHRMADVGAGTIDFKAILARATEGRIGNFFVEHDSPQDAMASARASYTYLSQLQF